MTASIAPRRLAFVLGVNQLLTWAMTFYAPAVVAGAAAAELGVPKAAVLGGFSWSLLIGAACAPWVGRRIGAQGGRGVLAMGAVVTALGLATLAAPLGLAGWYAGWTVLGAGMALSLYDAAFATAGVLLGTAVGPALTGITLIAGFASTLGWPMGAALVAAIGWRATLLCYAGVQLAVNLPLVLALIPPGAPLSRPAAAHAGKGRARALMAGCLASFFALRWFITSAIAVDVLALMGGLGLTAHEAVLAAMLIGPGQVLGRLAEWGIAAALGDRLGPIGRARMGALLFPAGALLLLGAGAVPLWAAAGFALTYGMSNGILTVNRGSLPMAVLGPSGYAAVLGWLAVPVLLAQAAAPTLAAPLLAAWPAREVLLMAGAAGFLGVGVFLLPLRAARA